MSNLKAYRENLEQPWGKLYYDILFHQLAFLEGKEILDFGSGFGIVSHFLAKKNQVFAVELNGGMLDDCKEDSSYQKAQRSLDVLQTMGNQTFDVIICHNVLEYVGDPTHYLKEFSRLLKEDGCLSIVKHSNILY